MVTIDTPPSPQLMWIEKVQAVEPEKCSLSVTAPFVLWHDAVGFSVHGALDAAAVAACAVVPPARAAPTAKAAPSSSPRLILTDILRIGSLPRVLPDTQCATRVLRARELYQCTCR